MQFVIEFNWVQVPIFELPVTLFGKHYVVPTSIFIPVHIYIPLGHTLLQDPELTDDITNNGFKLEQVQSKLDKLLFTPIEHNGAWTEHALFNKIYPELQVAHEVAV